MTMRIDYGKMMTSTGMKEREIKRNEPKSDWQNGITDYTDEDILDVLYHILGTRINDKYTRDEVYKVIEHFATNSVPAIPIHKVVAGWERVLNELDFEIKEELEEEVKDGLKKDDRQEQNNELIELGTRPSLAIICDLIVKIIIKIIHLIQKELPSLNVHDLLRFVNMTRQFIPV